MQSPRTTAEAALAETLDAVNQLHTAVDRLPAKLQAAIEPAVQRLVQASKSLPPHGPDPKPSSTSATKASPDPVPLRIPTPREQAARFALRHVLLAACMGLLGGMLIAASLNLRIPGLSG